MLRGHYSVHSDPSFTFIIDGHELKKNGQPVKMQSDGIALTPDGEWLYYKPLTDNKLYRVRTEYLRDEGLNAEELESKVEDLGRFNVTDGMAFDRQGNLYLGDMQNNSMVRITPELKAETIIQDDRLLWPDSYSLSHDGRYLYVSTSQIQKQPDYNDGENKRTEPYYIFRLELEN